MGMLLKVEGFTVQPTVEAMSIDCFQRILKRDKDKSKGNAIKELSYIEFMTSPLPTNPFRNCSEEDRPKEIRRRLSIPNSWKPDKAVKDCIKFIYDVFEKYSITYRYYMAAKTMVEKNIANLKDIDVSEEDENGKPKFKFKDVTDVVSAAPGVLRSLKELGEKVAEDRFETIAQRANRDRSIFADPESLKGVM